MLDRTSAKQIVQSSHHAHFAINSRVYMRSMTKIHDIVKAAIVIARMVPVLFWLPSGGGESWMLISLTDHARSGTKRKKLDG